MSEKTRQYSSNDFVNKKFKLEKKAIDLIEVYYGTKHIGEFVKDVDGFFMYFPTILHNGEVYNTGGGFTEWFLIEIANLLKSVNKEWQDQIAEYFKYPNKIFSEQKEFEFNNHETSRNTNDQ